MKDGYEGASDDESDDEEPKKRDWSFYCLLCVCWIAVGAPLFESTGR